jgi:hypothetical protein
VRPYQFKPFLGWPLQPWITKQYATGRPLIIGLRIAGALVVFGDLSTPVLRIRRKISAVATAIEFPVTSFVDATDTYNAQVVLDDWTALVPGEYIADVAATYNGALTIWPDGSYIEIRILYGAG